MITRPYVYGIATCVAALTVSVATPALAMDMDHMDHMGAHAQHAAVSSTKPAKSKVKVAPSTRAYEAAMATMHQQMNVPLLGNADVDFVRGMIPHHQAAVDMAKIQLQYGKDERLKSFSRWVIWAQELEIAQMKNWLRRRDNGAVDKNARDYFGEAMATMHHGMMITYTGDADKDFVRGMIPHHQGAIDMASILFTHGSDPELNSLANDIFDSQSYEVAWMQGWLAEHASN
jgi:uncharacterized protein (DUF305 family)